MRAAIVVLGDIGRSPRMTFHALSLASHNCKVDLIGYKGSRPHHRLVDAQNIRLMGIWESPDCLKYLPKTFLIYGLKFFWSLVMLWFTLMFRVGFLHFVLLQNPPGVPALMVCWLICRLKGARLIVDWHNYTCSILEWLYGPKSLIVRFAEKWEKLFGPRADLSLCVTHAMRSDLFKRWNVRAVTLYDRPPYGLFQPLSLEEKHNFFTRMAKGYFYRSFMSNTNSMNALNEGLADMDPAGDSTRFTYGNSLNPGTSEIRLRADRPALVVSSTSWTADEDFSILLSALERYDMLAKLKEEERADQLPQVLAVITGKGPMKAYYMELIKEKNFEKVEFLTPWLEAEDYPKMLASADIGVSLHTSTSGLDLPMKVVDMLGSGLPVLAKKFPCIDELVREAENGHLFDTGLELAEWLIALLRGFPLAGRKLDLLKQNLLDCPMVTWEDNWDATVWPLLEPLG